MIATQTLLSWFTWLLLLSWSERPSVCFLSLDARVPPYGSCALLHNHLQSTACPSHTTTSTRLLLLPQMTPPTPATPTLSGPCYVPQPAKLHHHHGHHTSPRHDRPPGESHYHTVRPLPVHWASSSVDGRVVGTLVPPPLLRQERLLALLR